MGNRKSVALAFLAGLIFQTVAWAGSAAETPAAGASGEERRILVAFRDATIGRVAVGESVGSYRRRGAYGSSTWGTSGVDDLADQYGVETMQQWPIPTLGMHCAVYRVPEDRSVARTLGALARDERVDLAEPMQIFHALSGANPDPYARLQSSLINMNVAAAHRYATGRDVEIAVIDTGIDANHPDLRDQVVDARNFTRAQDEKVADIHGTAVAGIIAAVADNGVGITGVAPGAKLLSLKACWPERPNQPESICDTFTLAQALNTAIERKVRIVNLSLAGPHDPLLELLIAKGASEGMIFVASIPPDGAADSFPASAPGVIAVRSAGSAPTPASLAPKVVTAPGTELLTTLPQGIYNFVTGSSYATAITSGVIALLLENHPNLDSRSLLGLLQHTAGRQASARGAAAENLDACGTLARLDSSIACPVNEVSGTPPRPTNMALVKG